LEQNGLEDAEHRAVCADAERKDGHEAGMEKGSAYEDAERKPHILAKRIAHRLAVLVAQRRWVEAEKYAMESHEL
jgi:hypothetical protein